MTGSNYYGGHNTPNLPMYFPFKYLIAHVWGKHYEYSALTIYKQPVQQRMTSLLYKLGHVRVKWVRRICTATYVLELDTLATNQYEISAFVSQVEKRTTISILQK